LLLLLLAKLFSSLQSANKSLAFLLPQQVEDKMIEAEN